jgi:hypothetical protein
MIALDEQQERVLADVAQIIRRYRGNAAASRFLKGARRIAIFGLSMWRFFRPWHFGRWNRQRIDEQRRAFTHVG